MGATRDPAVPPTETISGFGAARGPVALAHVRAAVTMVDRSGRVIHANSRACALTFGPTAGDPPTSLDEANALLHPDGRRCEPDERPVVRAMLAGVEVVDAAFTLVLPGGDRRRVRCDASPVRAANGAIVAGILTMIDVTEATGTPPDLEQALDAERSRIARDLHDGALQGLTRAIAMTGRDDELTALLRQVGRQMREAIYDLRLEPEPERPFLTALKELVEGHAALAPQCRVRLEGGEGLSGGAFGRRGAEVLKIAGEALTNARRHAGATQVVVGLTGSGTQMCLEVADDGCGFDPAGPPYSGQGLRGMRERAELLDAGLELSSDRSGTVVRLRAELGEAPATRVTRVLLVEDHATVRQALADAFERHRDIEVVGQAASLADARTRLAGVDVAVIDIGLPDGYGADLIDDLRRASPRAHALVLSGALDRAEVARAVARGAGGVLPKTAHLDDVVAAVRRLAAGETLMPVEEIVTLLRMAGDRRERELDDRAALAQLTPREREVLQAIADGLSSRQIADRLHISIRTERNHIANVLAKLGVHSQIQALLFALRYGAVRVPQGSSREREGFPGR